MPQDVTSKARIFKLHKIVELHACDIEATVVALTDFSKDVLHETLEEYEVWLR
jgi:hypothetical protein